MMPALQAWVHAVRAARLDGVASFLCHRRSLHLALHRLAPVPTAASPSAAATALPAAASAGRGCDWAALGAIHPPLGGGSGGGGRGHGR
jgi:hypothetical protein